MGCTCIDIGFADQRPALLLAQDRLLRFSRHTVITRIHTGEPNRTHTRRQLLDMGTTTGEVVLTVITRLPGPRAELWEWQLSGLCRTSDPNLFFCPEGERGPARRRRELAAKTVCLSCPVLQQCRSHALTVREPYGVWGGMTPEEREARLDVRVPAQRSRLRAV